MAIQNVVQHNDNGIGHGKLVVGIQYSVFSIR
jgi:hypothetical protein